jgi:hypothetical protein
LSMGKPAPVSTTNPPFVHHPHLVHHHRRRRRRRRLTWWRVRLAWHLLALQQENPLLLLPSCVGGYVCCCRRQPALAGSMAAAAAAFAGPRGVSLCLASCPGGHVVAARFHFCRRPYGDTFYLFHFTCFSFTLPYDGLLFFLSFFGVSMNEKKGETHIQNEH